MMMCLMAGILLISGPFTLNGLSGASDKFKRH
jgi:hypothetical protein